MKRNSFLVMIVSLVALVAGTAMADNSVPIVDDTACYVALPLTAVSPKGIPNREDIPDREVVLSVAKKDFEQAPIFASNSVPNMTRPDRAIGAQTSGLNYVNGIWTANPYTF